MERGEKNDGKGEKGKMERGVVELVDTESLVPSEHLLRKVDEAVDFRKLYEMVEPLYSGEDGRPSVDSVILFKIVLLQHLDGIPSLRGGCCAGRRQTSHTGGFWDIP